MIETATFEEITQIRLSREMDGKPVYWTSCYLVDGLLIDTGCVLTADELVDYLKDRPPRLVVNTHFHEDHVGGNRKVAEAFGVPVLAHRDSIPEIAHPPGLYPYQEFTWGAPGPFAADPLPDTLETGPFRLTVIETPGHSKGHVALVEKSRGWCFSGDIFAREAMKFIRPEEDMGQTVESMKKLMALPTERLVLFTSVGKIVEEGRAALGQCVAHLTGLAEKVRKLADQGMQIPEIVNELFGGEHPFSEMTNGQYTTENLVRSVLAIA